MARSPIRSLLSPPSLSGRGASTTTIGQRSLYSRHFAAHASQSAQSPPPSLRPACRRSSLRNVRRFLLASLSVAGGRWSVVVSVAGGQWSVAAKVITAHRLLPTAHCPLPSA